MACPFGWRGSPQFYGVAGNGISWLVRRESPHSMNPHLSSDTENFFCYEWVDDFFLAELDRGNRLASAEAAVKLSIIGTLGHTALSDSKTSTKWVQTMRYCGLIFELQHCTISMPDDKILDALERVRALKISKQVTKLQLQKVIGTLRYVSTCMPAARPFYQRLQSRCNHMRTGRPHTMDAAIMSDAVWFETILQYGKLQSIPTSVFGATIQTHHHCYMDACDVALAVLNPSIRQFILVKFDDIELEMILRAKAKIAAKNIFVKRQRLSKILTPCDKTKPPTDDDSFSINVREFFSVILAISMWGPAWHNPISTVHITMWLDNTAAVSWTNKLSSPNIFGQQLCRTLGLLLAKFNIHLTARHIPGPWNTIPDAGSRSFSCPTAAKTWISFSNSWSECSVPTTYRRVYQCPSNLTSMPWPQPPNANIRQSGTSINDGATEPTWPHLRSPAPKTHQKFSSPSLLTALKSSATTLGPSDPNFALSIGIISAPSVAPLYCIPATSLLLPPSNGPDLLPAPKHRSPSRCSTTSTSTYNDNIQSSTILFGGPSSLLTSSVCGLGNMPRPPVVPTMPSDSLTLPSVTAMVSPLTPWPEPIPSQFSSAQAKKIKPVLAKPGHFVALGQPGAALSSLRGAWLPTPKPTGVTADRTSASTATSLTRPLRLAGLNVIPSDE